MQVQIYYILISGRSKIAMYKIVVSMSCHATFTKSSTNSSLQHLDLYPSFIYLLTISFIVVLLITALSIIMKLVLTIIIACPYYPNGNTCYNVWFWPYCLQYFHSIWFSQSHNISFYGSNLWMYFTLLYFHMFALCVRQQFHEHMMYSQKHQIIELTTSNSTMMRRAKLIKIMVLRTSC